MSIKWDLVLVEARVRGGYHGEIMRLTGPDAIKSAADPDGLCAALTIRYACQQAPACSGSDSGGLCRRRTPAERNFADSLAAVVNRTQTRGATGHENQFIGLG